MAAAERRRGRRDNGLDATDWRAINDLDPRMAEDVLDLLATQGIAAYVQPAVDVDPVTRSATLPSRPSDRLYVDRQRVQAARECVRGLLEERPGQRGDAPPGDRPVPEHGDGSPPAGAGGERTGEPTADTGGAGDRGAGDSDTGGRDSDTGERDTGGRSAGEAATNDVDATFAGIVAGFDRQVDPTAASWPAVENVPGPTTTTEQPPVDPAETTERAGERDRPAGPVDARDVTEPSLLDALDSFGTELPDEEPPERFVPPPPPPLPRLSRQTVLGWVAIAVGLVLLIGNPDAVPLDRSNTMLLGFACILGGAVALILRLRPGSDPDDSHPDDGARV